VSDKWFNRVMLLSIALLVVLLVFLATGAFAQSSSVLTHPRWVADTPATGEWIPTWTQAAGDTLGQVISGISAIECVATTKTKFVAYSSKRRPLPDIPKNRVKWPLFGVGAFDTCYTVPAGETRTYLFAKPFVQYIIVTSGDAIFSGE
jgi:hypothetical protein